MRGGASAGGGACAADMGGRSLRTRDKTSAARAEVVGDSGGGILPDTPPSPLLSVSPDPLPVWGFSCASAPGSTLHTCPGLLPSPRPLLRPRLESPPDPPTRVPSRLPRPGSSQLESPLASLPRVSSRLPPSQPGLPRVSRAPYPRPPQPGFPPDPPPPGSSPDSRVPPSGSLLASWAPYLPRRPGFPTAPPPGHPSRDPPLWSRFLSSPVPEGDWTLPP